MNSVHNILFVLCSVVLKVYGGPFNALLYSNWITCDHSRELNIDVKDIYVYFYDFNNNVTLSYPINDAVSGLTRDYQLDFNKKLIFFIPGYKSHIIKKTENLVRNTFRGIPDIYLIIVDHSTYTSDKGGRIESYQKSVLNSYYIGKALGELLVDLHNKGYPSNKIHGLGHSLGSQMLAVAGDTYFNMTSQKIWRATGLDPAGPCFSNSLIQNQIRSGIAEYVEVYHCNSGGLGTTAVLADTDFFFNHDGRSQPHCSGSIIPGVGESDVAKCSHKACVRYWAETVHRPGWYLAWACDSYEQFKKGRCSGNQVTIAGYSNPGNATGVFYVSTELYNVY